MGVPSHQSAGQIAVGNEEESRREFIPFRGFHGHIDLAMFAAQADPLARRDLESFHVGRCHLQSIDFGLIGAAEFPLANSAALVARSAGDKNEGFHGAIVATRVSAVNALPFYGRPPPIRVR